MERKKNRKGRAAATFQRMTASARRPADGLNVGAEGEGREGTMSIAIGGGQAAAPIPVRTSPSARAPGLRRGLLALALLAGAGWAAHAGSSAETADAVARAGSELTRLLRCMAVLKAGMAAAALAAVWWRLALPAGAGWTVAYLAAGAAASAGPVLIWGMAHLGLGALLLHAGLFAMLVLLWRDPAVAAELGAMVAERRRALASR